MSSAPSSSRRRSRGSSSDRHDAHDGFVERARFLGPPGESIFSILSMPDGPVGAVLVASSLLTDRIRLYRAEVAVARRLAAAGFAVIRFDYRGFGHSDGVTGVSVAVRMADDVGRAASEIRETTGIDPLTFLGVRFGALLANAEGCEPERAVLWDPVISGRDYFRSAFRAHMVGRLSRSRDGATPNEELEATGRTTVLGFTVSKELVESSEGLRMDSIALPSTEFLWLESGDRLTGTRAAALEGLRSKSTVELECSPSDDAGWFVGARPLENKASIDRIVSWIAESRR